MGVCTIGICFDGSWEVRRLFGEQYVLVEVVIRKKRKRTGQKLVRDRTVMSGRLSFEGKGGQS